MVSNQNDTWESDSEEYSGDDGEENPSKPFLRPVRKYGSHLARVFTNSKLCIFREKIVLEV